MQFYRVARARCFHAAEWLLGVPGDRFSVKKHAGTQVRVMVAHSGARSRPKVALGTPGVAKMEPQSSLLGGLGDPFG